MSEIPEEAVKAIARQVFYAERGVDWEFEWADNTKRAEARQRAMNLALIGLLAALPHLRVQETPAGAPECGGKCYSLTESGAMYLDTRCPKHSGLAAPHPRPVVDREALATLAAEWQQSADEDERYLNSKVHASEVHDVMASIRINREHADAVLALLPTEVAS